MVACEQEATIFYLDLRLVWLSHTLINAFTTTKYNMCAFACAYELVNVESSVYKSRL